MRSKTLSSKGLFSPALFRNDLVRFWPLWALYLAMWLLIMPAFQFLELFGQGGWGNSANMRANALNGVAGIATGGALAMSVAFGCLFAMALFSYLTGARAVGFAHALPVRREGLFLTHYLAGAAVFVGTHALTAALTALVWSAAGLGELWMVGLWFLYATGQMLFFYGFAVLCAAFAGQMLAIPVFYGVFNWLIYGLTNLFWLLCQTLLYGWSYPGDSASVIWLTPIYKLAQLSWDRWGYHRGSAEYWSSLWNGLGTVGVYALAGVLMAAAALLVYRRRRSEAAGDTVAVTWARPVFRYGVGVCAALSLGQLLYIILWDAFGRVGESAAALTACMVLLGLVGYFAAEMLLQKSFRVVKRGWKGGAVLTAALVLVCAGLAVDLLGVERRVPAAEDVESLSFGISGELYTSGEVKDPETVALFLALHRTLVEERPAEENGGSGDTVYGNVYLDYTLKNGRQMGRRYSFTFQPGEDAPLRLELTALAREAAVQRANLENFLTNDTERIASAEIYLGGERGALSFDGDTARALLEALERDVDAGHAGAYLFDPQGWRENTYSSGLTFYYRDEGDQYAGRPYASYSNELQFSRDYTYLLAALEKAGVDLGLLTTYQESYDTEAYDKYGMSAYYDEQSYAYEDGNESQAPEVLVPEIAAEPPSAAVIGGADGPTAILVG